MTRRRLAPAERRDQLLDLGAVLFATLPYDEVHIEKVAEQAGVSRGLLYHYFPTKRAFFAELVRRATARLAADTEAAAELPPLEQLVSGVQRYLEHVRDHWHATRSIYRGAVSADAEVQEIVDASTELFVRRIVDVLEPDRTPSELLEIAVRSWVMLMRAAGQELLDHPDVTVPPVRDVCVSAFVGLVTALPDGVRPARVDELLGSSYGG